MYTHNIQYGVHNIAKTNTSLNIFICIIMTLVSTKKLQDYFNVLKISSL